MFLDIVFMDFLLNIVSLNYVFVAFGFFGINLGVQYLVMRKRL